MHRLRWLVLFLALVEGGWLAFDGAYALVTGDYVTPTTGQHAGQLGAWSHLVSLAGIEPRSTLMKSIHLVLGTAWLAVMVGFASNRNWAWAAMIICAVLASWYLPFGTMLSALQVVLLLLIRRQTLVAKS